jgi:hypothetical protein
MCNNAKKGIPTPVNIITIPATGTFCVYTGVLVTNQSFCEYIIIVFPGMKGKRSRFIGVFKVEGFITKPNSMFQYHLVELPGFEEPM